MKEILKKLRKYEIKIRKAITSQMQGDYHSIFKGSGLEFDDVRTYQYGDDVRTIDWNVSAKGHGTFVKTFKEEKEQTVFFILDMSASQEIGKEGAQKLDIAKEIAALLSIAAIKENSQVGLIGYTDQPEIYVKPAKGMRHSYQLVSKIFETKTKSRKTDLSKAIHYSLEMIKKKSVLIMISDFIDEDYFHNLKALAKLHDLVIIHLSDKRETFFPKLGIVPVIEKETGKTIWVNSSSGAFRGHLDKLFKGNREELKNFCMRNQVNYVEIDTEEDYVPKLIKLFRVRNKSLKSVR